MMKSLESPDLASQVIKFGIVRAFRFQEDIAVALRAAAGWLASDHNFSRSESDGYRQLLGSHQSQLKQSSLLDQPSAVERLLQSGKLDSDGPGAGWFYPTGPMADLVYAVDGGFEDWSYSSSWQNSPNPISVGRVHNGCIILIVQTCEPSTYGGYPSSRTNYTSSEALR